MNLVDEVEAVDVRQVDVQQHHRHAALIERRARGAAIRHGDHLFEKQELFALAAGAGLQVIDYVEKGIVFLLTAARAEG